MRVTAFSTRHIRWKWIAFAWGGVGLIDASQTVFPMRAQGMHHRWAFLFASQILIWLPWALATPWAILLGRRYPLAARTRLRHWIVHLVAVLMIGLLFSSWGALLEMLLNPWAQTPPPGPLMAIWPPKFYNEQLTSVVLYAFLLTTDHLFESRRRVALHHVATAQLNEQLQKAQLDTLRHQLEPHFMFNSLNAISGLVRDNRNEAAVDMIVVLSEFLRGATADLNRPCVTLEREVKLLRQFVEIERTRFSDRLRVSFDIPVTLLSVQVPSLILQLLVENAIKHGISQRVHGGAIHVAAFRDGSALKLSVENDGPTLVSDWEVRCAGIGIANLRTRLRLMYGEDFMFCLRNRDTTGVHALVSLPLIET